VAPGLRDRDRREGHAHADRLTGRDVEAQDRTDVGAFLGALRDAQVRVAPRLHAARRARRLGVVVHAVARVVEEAVEATRERGVALGRRADRERRAVARAEVVAQVDHERARAGLVEGVLVHARAGRGRDARVDRARALGEVVDRVEAGRGLLVRVRVALAVRARARAGREG